MRRPSDRSARCRAVLAVAALYGLLLQVFLVSLQPLPLAPGGGIICAAHEDGTQGDRDGTCPQHLCCLAAHVAQPLVPPVPASISVAAPLPRVLAPIRPVADLPPVRGPPNRAVSSRGPPSA
jgi:hypothetical protein